jgi:hypothetical protein
MALPGETCNFEATTKKAKTMTDAALAYTVKDCREAALAEEELLRAGYAANPGKYWDEFYTYGREQARRELAAMRKAN